MLHILSILRLSLRMRIARPLSTSSNFCHQKAGQCSEPSSDINIQSAGRDVEAEVRVRFAPSPTGKFNEKLFLTWLKCSSSIQAIYIWEALGLRFTTTCLLEPKMACSLYVLRTRIRVAL